MIRHLLGILLLGLLLAFSMQARATTVASLEDITFWVGTGNNETALSIDWEGNNSTSESLTWGYRWNDPPTPEDPPITAEDMLRDVLAADSRLYAKFSTAFGIGVSVIGLGYDASNDGAFALQDGTAFDSSGIATIAGTSDFVPPVDAADFYIEGWGLAGFWHLSHNTSGVWNSANGGISVDSLVAGRWHGFAFTPTYSMTAFPTNLLTAAPPALAGDFNGDGTVDAADYSVWRDNAGDNLSPADYILWHNNFGNTYSSNSLAIPEPATAWLVFSLLAMAWPAIGTRRV